MNKIFIMKAFIALVNFLYCDFFELVRKTPHTTHKGGSQVVSHVQEFTKWAGCPREDCAAVNLG
jgi:hypothetical protein